jgi:hypothetical protein
MVGRPLPNISHIFLDLAAPPWYKTLLPKGARFRVASMKNLAEPRGAWRRHHLAARESGGGENLASYILCQRKRNLPRIDVRICQERCPERDACQEFRAFQARLVSAQPEELVSTEQPG